MIYAWIEHNWIVYRELVQPPEQLSIIDFRDKYF